MTGSMTGRIANRPLRTAIVALMVVLAGSWIAGCGKRGDLEPPEGRKSEYPRTYPAP